MFSVYILMQLIFVKTLNRDDVFNTEIKTHNMFGYKSHKYMQEAPTHTRNDTCM